MIGQSPRRKEDERLITGQSDWADNTPPAVSAGRPRGS